MEGVRCALCPGMATVQIILDKKEWPLCEWDERRLRDYCVGVQTNHMANVFWGAGHISWTCWETIRGIIREHKLTDVLEFGTGLSSELFVNEGLQVTSFDACLPHHEKYKALLSTKNGAKFHFYFHETAEFALEKEYPGRQWDFVFVDGPQERSFEVRAAMKAARKFIYLHDPNMGEQDFFPGDEWVGIGTEPRLFVRKGAL